MIERILGKDIYRYIKAYKGLIFLSILLTAFASVSVVVPAYLLKPFIDKGMISDEDKVSWKIPWIELSLKDEISISKSEKTIVDNISPNLLLIIITIIAFLSVLFRAGFTYLGQLCGAAFSNRAIMRLREDLFNKFLSLSHSFYHRQKIGELISRATADITVMQERIANIIIGLVQYPIMALVFLVYLLFMNWIITLIVIITAPMISFFIRLFGRKVKKHSRMVQEVTSQLTSMYQEAILCLRIIQGFCMERKVSDNFKEKAHELYRRVMHWNRWFLGIGPFMDSTVFLIIPGVFILGKSYFHHTLGELISMVYAFSQVYSPFKNLARLNSEIKTLHGATERVFNILNTPTEIKEHPNAKPLGRHRESIEFINVSFSYNGKEEVLKGISFKIRAGEMAAFVGSTGSGKSTLLSLIPRFYDVTSGSIRIDGVDIRDVTLQSLRRQIGLVSQDVLLFHDTIANNIGFGTFDFDMKDIEKAAKMAYAHGFILDQPKGYETIVGDRGTLLSGGQKQRIALARALMVNPSILLLDEAASALDSESERMIQETIESLKGKITILVVAHRLSTIKGADIIFVLEEGRIVESGNMDELLQKGGRFRQLYNIQFESFA